MAGRVRTLSEIDRCELAYFDSSSAMTGANPLAPIVRDSHASKIAKRGAASVVMVPASYGYFSFSYSALAVLRIGTSGSASFHAAKKSW